MLIMNYLFSLVLLVMSFLFAPMFVFINVAKNTNDTEKGIKWGVITFIIFFVVIFVL